MRVGYHSAVQQDLNRILRRYDKESSRLGDEFWAKLNKYVEAAEANRLRSVAVSSFRSSLVPRELNRFPYQFLHRILSDRIRVIAVRHHKQDPRFGLHCREDVGKKDGGVCRDTVMGNRAYSDRTRTSL